MARTNPPATPIAWSHRGTRFAAGQTSRSWSLEPSIYAVPVRRRQSFLPGVPPGPPASRPIGENAGCRMYNASVPAQLIAVGSSHFSTRDQSGLQAGTPPRRRCRADRLDPICKSSAWHWASSRRRCVRPVCGGQCQPLADSCGLPRFGCCVCSERHLTG